MTALSTRLALLLEEFRSWDPNEPPRETANGLARRFNLELGTVLRIAQSEGFDLDDGEPLELTASDIEVIEDRDADDLPEGSKIGRYELLKKLGAGGMGVVYVAYDPTLSRRIAIKILRSNISDVSDEDPVAARRRILREAQAMAQVSSHPNIVPVYDVGTYGDRVFIAMEYVEGRPINEHIEVKRLGWKEIRTLYLKAAEGLRAAHEAGLVHRDFKPDNVLVDNHGRVKVMDFGLARSSMGRASASMRAKVAHDDSVPLHVTLTATGQIMGTPAYMAPEQFMLEPVDARADQFSFCVAMYEALTGYRPYQATSFRELARKVLNNRIIEPPRDTKVPDWVFDTLFKGLSTERQDRWPTMRHLCEALMEPPPHLTEKARRTFTRRVAIGVGVACAAVAVGVQYLVKPSTKAATEHSDPPDGIEVRPQVYQNVDVHQTITQHSRDVRKCYSALLVDSPDLVGRVVVTFTVSPDGRVLDPVVRTNTVGDERLADCIRVSTLFWKFPRPSSMAEVEVTYPFVFAPSSG